MSDKILRYSVSVNIDGARSVSYTAGTPLGQIPDEHRAKIEANPRLVWEGEVSGEPDADLDETEFVTFDAPTSLEGLSPKELRGVAEFHGVGLGNLKRKEDMIEVLVAAGVGVRESL